MDPNAFADLVVGVVKSALSPILERVAAVETRVSVLGDVRDRVIGLETKTAMPVVLPPVVESDLGPMTARVAALEAQMPMVVSVLDRLVGLETKAALAVVPPKAQEVDLGPMTARVVAVEAQMQAIAEVRDRVAALEAKAHVVPVDHGKRIDELAVDVGELGDAVAGLNKSFAEALAAMRERVAVVETKAGIPGPPGPAGGDGKDGAPGKDGRDGLHGKDGAAGQNGTLENLKIVRHGERLLEFAFKDGTPVEGGSIRLSHPSFKGVYGQVPEIERDDLVQYAGAVWIALKDNPTMKPGSGSPEITGWRMFSKAGRDGKDAHA